MLPIGVVGNFSNPEDAQNAIFSPDGKVVALIPFSSGITLWDTASGRPLRSLTQRPYFTASAFSEDGRQMVTGHKDGTVRVWDIETGAVIAGRGTARQVENRQGRGPRPDPYRLGRSARRIVRHLRWRRRGHDLEPDKQEAGAHGTEPRRHDAASFTRRASPPTARR